MSIQNTDFFFVCEMNKDYIYTNNVLCVGLHFYVYVSKPPRSKRLVSAIIKSIGTVFVRYYISLNKYVNMSLIKTYKTC